MEKDNRVITINLLFFGVKATVREFVFLLIGVGIGLYIKLWIAI